MNSPKKQTVFELEAHTGVMQDKSDLIHDRSASDQTYRHTDQIRLNQNVVQSNSADRPEGLRSSSSNPNHNSTSPTEPLVPLTTQIPRSLKDEIQRQAKQEDMSDSATAAAFLKKAIQGNIDMQYGAMLKPVIENTFNKAVNQSLRSGIKRAGDLSLEAFYSSEETRVYSIYILRFLLGEDQELLHKIIKEVHEQARANVNRVLHHGNEETKDINEQN